MDEMRNIEIICDTLQNNFNNGFDPNQNEKNPRRFLRGFLIG